jgi:hypothetical protein
MKMRNTKIAVITLGVAVIASMAASLRADDTTTPATPAASAPADQTADSKFSGPVTAVDTNAMTFTVNDQTFTITTESHISRKGKTATLADVVLGEPAKGTYTKDADGKLEVSKVRFGKKAGAKKKKSLDTDTSATNAAPGTAQSQ